MTSDISYEAAAAAELRARCGTPVLAYRAGAVPEVIDEGVTGLIFDNIDQARIASVRGAALDRRKVRGRFEERFTARRMAKDYVRVYQSLCLSRRPAWALHEISDKRGRTHQWRRTGQCRS